MTGYLQRLALGAAAHRPRLRPLAAPPDNVVLREFEEHVERPAPAMPARASDSPVPTHPRAAMRDDLSPRPAHAAEAAPAAHRAQPVEPVPPRVPVREPSGLPFVPLWPAEAARDPDPQPQPMMHARVHGAQHDVEPGPAATSAHDHAPSPPVMTRHVAPAAAGPLVPAPAVQAASAPAAGAASRAGARGTRDVEIHIGRVEVVAVPEPRPAVAAPAPRRAPSLDDYLMSRGSR